MKKMIYGLIFCSCLALLLYFLWNRNEDEAIDTETQPDMVAAQTAPETPSSPTTMPGESNGEAQVDPAATAQGSSARAEEAPASDGPVKVYGTVVMKSDGKPVAGATVQLISGRERLDEIVSTDQGHFSFLVDEEGGYHLYSFKDHLGSEMEVISGRAILVRPTYFRIDGDVTEVGPLRVALLPATLLKVQVNDFRTQVPLAGVNLAPFPLRHLSQKTDLEGKGLLRLPPGTWKIEAIAPHYVIAQKTVHIAGSRMQSLAFQLEPGGVFSGSVTDADGKPLAKCGVNFSGSQTYATTDESGFFELQHLPLETRLEIQFFLEGYQSHGVSDLYLTRAEPFAERHVVLKLNDAIHKNGAFLGRVIDELGQPLQDYQVLFQNADGYPGDATFLPDGIFQITGLEMNASIQTGITILKKGYQEKYLSIEAKPSGTVVPTDITLKKGHWLGGRITNAAGEPVVKAMVRHIRPKGGMNWAETDEQGFFTIEGLPNIRQFTIDSSHYSNRLLTVEKLDHDEVVVVLEPLGGFFGKVVDAQSGEAVKQFQIRVSLSENKTRNLWRFPSQFREPVHFSNDQGRFTLADMDQGMPLYLMVMADGYETKTFDPVHVTANQQGESNPQVLALTENKTSINGHVRDERGQPLSQAEVFLNGFPQDQVFYISWNPYEKIRTPMEHEIRAMTITDADGYFQLKTPPREFDFNLLVLRPGQAMVQLTNLQQGPPESTSGMDVVMAPEATLFGLINLDRFPGRLTLSAFNPSLPQVKFLKILGPGVDQYQLELLPMGKYTLSLIGQTETDRLSYLTEDIELGRGEHRELNLGFEEQFDFAGRALVGGQPMAGAVLFLLDRPVELTASLQSVTADAAGRFLFEDCSPGSYDLVAFTVDPREQSNMFAFGWNPNRVEIDLSVPIPERDYSFAKQSKVTGRLAFRENGTIALSPASGDGLRTLMGTLINGFIKVVDVPPGVYQLTHYRSGGGRQILLPEVRVPEDGSDVDLGEIALQKTGNLNLHLKGTQPFGQMDFLVLGLDRDSDKVRVVFERFSSIDQGVIRLTDVPPGYMRIVVLNQEFALESRSPGFDCQVVSEKTTDLTVEMLALTSLMVTTTVKDQHFESAKMVHQETGETLIFQREKIQDMVSMAGRSFALLDHQLGWAKGAAPGKWLITVTGHQKAVWQKTVHLVVGKPSYLQVVFQ